MMWTLTNESYKLEVPPPEWTTENLRSVGRQCLLLAVLVISFWSLHCFFQTLKCEETSPVDESSSPTLKISKWGQICWPPSILVKMLLDRPMWELFHYSQRLGRWRHFLWKHFGKAFWPISRREYFSNCLVSNLGSVDERAERLTELTSSLFCEYWPQNDSDSILLNTKITLRLVPYEYNLLIFFQSLAQRQRERRGWSSWRKKSAKWWRRRWTSIFFLQSYAGW